MRHDFASLFTELYLNLITFLTQVVRDHPSIETSQFIFFLCFLPLQYCPLYPTGHTHLSPLDKSKHVPPCLQGFLSQVSGS